MLQRSRYIDTGVFAFTVFGLVLLHKFASFLTPYKLYFSFSSFLYNESSLLKWQALLIKLALPTLFGFALFVALFWMLLVVFQAGRPTRPYIRLLRDAAEPSIELGALFAAILLAWPFLVYWDVLIEPTLRENRLQFVLAYALYFVAYYYFAGLGVQLAKLYLSRRYRNREVLKGAAVNFSWADPVRKGAAGAVTSLVATYVTSMASAVQAT